MWGITQREAKCQVPSHGKKSREKKTQKKRKVKKVVFPVQHVNGCNHENFRVGAKADAQGIIMQKFEGGFKLEMNNNAVKKFEGGRMVSQQQARGKKISLRGLVVSPLKGGE